MQLGKYMIPKQRKEDTTPLTVMQDGVTSLYMTSYEKTRSCDFNFTHFALRPIRQKKQNCKVLLQNNKNVASRLSYSSIYNVIV